MHAHTRNITASTQRATYVVATGAAGSRAALATAIPLARGLGTRLVVLIPHIVPYPLSVDGPVDSTAFVARRYREVVLELNGEADIRVCLCRRVDEVILQLLPPASTVVVGGRAGRWLPSREERLARALSRRGHHAVFAPLSGSESEDRSMAEPHPTSYMAALLAALSLVGAPHLATARTTEGAPQNPPPDASAAQSPAAEPSPLAWQYGGFVDVGYLRDFNDPSNHLFRSRGTAWHVDDWHVNMAGAYVKKKASEPSRWGTELLVQGGKDSEVFGFSATAPNISGAEWMLHLGLANVSYLAPAGKGLTLQAGIFASLIGYDSLYAKDNFNYTRPWGADFTPYLMTGVNASYPFTDNVTGTFVLVNGYWHLADANSVPSSGGQLAYKASPSVTVKETVLWGPHQSNTSLKFWRFLSDTIAELKGDRVVGAFEYQLSTERVDALGNPRAWWMSAQLPLHLSVHGPWSVSVRPEVAWDSDGRWTSHEQSIAAVTTTLEYRMGYRGGNTILRLEHRFDDSRGKDGGFFTDGEVSPGVVGLKPTQQLLVFGLIFTFDSPSQR